MHFGLRIGAIAALAFLGSCNNDGAHNEIQAKAPMYSCYRHVYNNSACPWTFQAETNVQYGNVYFGGGNTPACTQQNGPCTLAANTSIEIQYTTTDGSAQGVMDITDQTGTKKSWYYVNGAVDQCPDYHHSGNTGAVALNDPADGDLNAWGQCTWNK